MGQFFSNLSCCIRHKPEPLKISLLEESSKSDIKVVVVGHHATGKSCLIGSRNVSMGYQSTIGLDTRPYEMCHFPFNLVLWEITAAPNFEMLANASMKTAQATVILYDTTNRDTFDNLEDRWFAKGKKPMLLVGTKVDLTNARQVSREEGRRMAQQLGAQFIEVTNLSEESREQVFCMMSTLYQLMCRKPRIKPCE